MIILKDKIRTSEVKFCEYNPVTKKMDIEFQNGKTYSYAYSNVEWLKEPNILNPNQYQISKSGRIFYYVEAIYVFQGSHDTYWHICFEGGSERDYIQSELNIVESCLKQDKAEDVFAYIRQIAELSNLRSEETGEKILAKRFSKINFVGNDVALAVYLNPSLLQRKKVGNDYVPIFPFGCNNSQYQAVKRAMENQISVIQGPPGTGKTQTILNIIANILLDGKTVQVVSNNNSATENVYEKLASPQYNLGFVVAALGKKENKQAFIASQSEHYPDFSSWKLQKNQQDVLIKIKEKSMLLKDVFEKREQLARLKQEHSRLITEFEYFKQYVEEHNVDTELVTSRKNLTSGRWMDLWQECQLISEKKDTIGLWFRFKLFLQCGSKNVQLYKQQPGKLIATFQSMYYQAKQAELTERIATLEKELQKTDPHLLESLCKQSMAVLKDTLAEKYGDKQKRTIFSEDDLWKNPYEFLNEYPIILSTTFSSRNSLKTDVIYDYVIMDEASQVDVATGALALSCARNIVIVGDTKQLPNVVTGEDKRKAKAVFDCFDISDGYQFTNSFLKSVLDVIPDVSQTLLREHYRCHPKIIEFCNQKFYKGELITMTVDKGEENVLAVVRTVPGNHVRNHYSQRQIDVIRNEIIPGYVTDREGTGIIAPYKNQVEALEREFGDMDVATVHKFQGREKDTIILSTVDDEISDFADDPYLINVAVSRAKNKLMLVVSGNRQSRERNITDLIAYIQYHNFEIVDSKIYSVFDYLYEQYAEERKAYLKKHRKISVYNSENLMYSLLEDILTMPEFTHLEILCHFPMNMLIKNTELLNEKEYQYIMNPATHLDFLICNRISKKPVLAIEVDGYKYHRDGTEQASRDLQKNHILELYQIPLLRFKTNGSGEKEQIIKKLNELV